MTVQISALGICITSCCTEGMISMKKKILYRINRGHRFIPSAYDIRPDGPDLRILHYLPLPSIINSYFNEVVTSVKTGNIQVGL